MGFFGSSLEDLDGSAGVLWCFGGMCGIVERLEFALHGEICFTWGDFTRLLPPFKVEAFRTLGDSECFAV